MPVPCVAGVATVAGRGSAESGRVGIGASGIGRWPERSTGSGTADVVRGGGATGGLGAGTLAGTLADTMAGAGLAAAGAGVGAAFAVGFEGAFTEDVPTGRPALTAAVTSAIAFAMPRSGAAVGRVGAAGEGATPATVVFSLLFTMITSFPNAYDCYFETDRPST